MLSCVHCSDKAPMMSSEHLSHATTHWKLQRCGIYYTGDYEDLKRISQTLMKCNAMPPVHCKRLWIKSAC